MELLHKTIGDLLAHNVFMAKALHFLGVRFQDYSDRTLADVCAVHRLEPQSVIRYLEQAATTGHLHQLPFHQFSISLIVEYLRHSHHLFIKHRLPYLKNLIAGLDETQFCKPEIVQDLKEVFPLFAQDFIIHIYHEEDELFGHIDQLLQATRGIANSTQLYLLLERNSVAHYGVEHQGHEDEMAGIRQLTNSYDLPADAGLHQRILYAELQHFEQELSTHARIENHVLFPKAVQLENEVRWRLTQKVKLN